MCWTTNTFQHTNLGFQRWSPLPVLFLSSCRLWWLKQTWQWAEHWRRCGGWRDVERGGSHRLRLDGLDRSLRGADATTQTATPLAAQRLHVGDTRLHCLQALLYTQVHSHTANFTGINSLVTPRPVRSRALWSACHMSVHNDTDCHTANCTQWYAPSLLTGSPAYIQYGTVKFTQINSLTE